MSSRVFSVPTLLVLFFFAAVARASSSWFPFSPSGLVTPGSAVDASDLLIDYAGEDPAAVIDARGHLQTGSDGHFHFVNTGQRARFFGVNMMTNTMFPPFADAPQQPGEYSDIVPPAAADQLATRLAQMGVNVVRLHFMEGPLFRPASIWDPNFPNDTQHFDQLQLARLDYMIYRLKAHGIYCDLNLHVGRTFRSQDGVTDFNLFPATSYDKPATEFDPTMITLQQQYANQLLTHVNPYTNMRLADDPAIAFVQISNEDSMMSAFGNNQLGEILNSSQCLQGAACGLPASYGSELDQMWNNWLIATYGSDAILQASWAPPADVNAVQDSCFSGGLSGWNLETFGGASGTDSIDSSQLGAARVDISAVSGQLWGVQLDQSGLSLKAGQLYDLAITFKGTSGEQLGVDLIQDQSPYAFYQTLGILRRRRIGRQCRQPFRRW